ncbi:MAG: MFS transporter [Acidobacteria bacterium]|nr:MFS transporter [Acidobacteriota bacterium]
MANVTLTPAASTHERRGLALAVIAAAQLMVMLDLTITNVALPSIQTSLHFSTTNLTWVIDAYVLVFGGLLLLGGRAGDIFGRRRMFFLGIGLFAAASLLGGLATSQGLLVGARALQGVGAAIASPTALALIAVTFPEGAARNRAMAVYAAMTAAGGALGLILGGALVEAASWRWVFFVNVPIGVVVMVATPYVLPRIDGHGGRLDVPGAVTVSGGVAFLVYGLVRAPSIGWGATETLASFVAAAVLLVVFALVERRSDQPLIPPHFLRHRNRAGGYITMMLIGASMLSLLFFLTQFLQEQMHYSSLRAGVSYLPVPIMVAGTSVFLSRKIKRFGVRIFLTTGPLLVALGVFWASFLTPTDSYWHVLGPLVIFGLGMGFSFVPLTLNAVSSVQNHEQGLASSLLNTSQQIGGSLGLAVLVTVAATVRAHQLTGPRTLDAAQAQINATVQGFHVALRVGALSALLAFITALLVVRTPRPHGVGAPSHDAAPTPAPRD